MKEQNDSVETTENEGEQIAKNVEVGAKAEKEKKTEEKSTKKNRRSVTKSKNSNKKYKDEIEILKQKNGELTDKYLRLVAEYDNFRKRNAREKIELREQVKSNVLFDFLSVVDDIDRAMQHIADSKDIDSLKEGVGLINHKFYDFLKTQGVNEIEAKDKEFDTDLHEAITKFPVEEKERKGKVVDVIQKGYKINERVIRFSKVVVGE